jgi:hypothetical protein
MVPADSRPPAAPPILVTVNQGARETVRDMGAAFSTVSGLQHRDGLRLSVLANTNYALVRTDLSQAALTLTFVPGKYGTATITVCATDADGVSARQTIVVTVRPVDTRAGAFVPPIPPISTTSGYTAIR